MQHSARRTLLLLSALAVCAAWLVATSADAQHSVQSAVVARVTIRDADDVRHFIALGLDLLELREGDDYFILTTPAQVQQLSTDGWLIRVDVQQTALLHPTSLDTFMGGYRTVLEMRAFLDAKATSYPTLTQVFTYGKSYEGRDLFGISLTNNPSTTLRTSQTNPTNKPTFFLMAAIHARELSTSELALRLVDYLLSNYGADGDATWLLDEHQIVVVPVANPDGRVIAEQGFYQRKNTDPIGGNCGVPNTGVDLNRNADFKWGTVNAPSEPPCGQTYPGPTPASEPEVVALQTLVRSLFLDQRGPNDGDAAPITTTGILLTLHSYSNLVLYPWGWTNAQAPNNDSLARIGGKFASYNGYTPGQPGFLLYNTSSTTDDWSYGELGIASFTFEVGLSSGLCGGFFPPFSCLDRGSGGSFWPLNLPAFLYAARIARAPYQLTQGPTTEAITATRVASNRITVRAQLSEQFNGGQVITAAEYYVDTPPWRGGIANAMTAQDGAFDSPNEIATANAALTGRQLIFVRGQDANGNWGPLRAVWVNAPPQRLWLPFVAR